MDGFPDCARTYAVLEQSIDVARRRRREHLVREPRPLLCDAMNVRGEVFRLVSRDAEVHEIVVRCNGPLIVFVALFVAPSRAHILTIIISPRIKRKRRVRCNGCNAWCNGCNGIAVALALHLIEALDPAGGFWRITSCCQRSATLA
jgi:hypothetical protein